MLQRLFTPSPLPISTNPYFLAALDAFKKSKPSDSRPNPSPADVLAKIVQAYLDRAGNATGVGYRNHDTHAKELLKILAGINPDRAYYYINNILNMQEESSFSRALGTFFSLYPENFALITTGSIRKVIERHVCATSWKAATKLKLEAFIEAHKSGNDSPHFERLAALSLVIPGEMADTYSDFLLALLTHKRSDESHAGLYRGWVYIALGNLSNQPLSFNKKEMIIKALKKELSTAKMSLSSIGLCQALATISNDYRQSADFLIKFFTTEFKNYLHLYQGHQKDPTLTLYMQNIFQAITHLTKTFENEQKEKIISICTAPENLYLLRDGIKVIYEWLSEKQKADLLHRINHHQEFTSLVCEFQQKIRYEKSNPEWPMQKRYAETLSIAKAQLHEADIRKFRILEQVQLLRTDGGMTDEDFIGIIKNLFETALEGHPTRAEGEQLSEIYSTLATLSNRCQEPVRVQMAALMHKATFEVRRDNTTETQIKTASSALKLAKQQTPTHEKELVMKLLVELDSKAAPYLAARALEEYLKQAASYKLPLIMMHLMTMDTPHAQFLLVRVEHLYQEKLLAETPAPAKAPQHK